MGLAILVFLFFLFFGSMGLAILVFCFFLFFWFFHGRLQLYQTFVQADANAHVLPNQANFAHSRGSLFCKFTSFGDSGCDSDGMTVATWDSAT